MEQGERRDIERELSERLRGVRLVLEIGIDRDLVERAQDVVRQIALRDEAPEEALGRYLPATLATFLVALGIDKYNGSLWPHQPIPGLDPTRLGRAFEKAIRSLRLETFEHLEDDRGHRYLMPILAHGGIPKHASRDYIRLVAREVRRNGGAPAEELIALWRTRRTVFENIDVPVRRFMLYGGPVAVDFLDRTIELVQTPLSDLTEALAQVIGLPSHILDAFRAVARDVPDVVTGRAARQFPRPTVRFDPWSGMGPEVELPAVGSRFAHAEWYVTDDVRRRRYETSLVAAQTQPLAPSASWEVEFQGRGADARTYAFEGFGDTPVVWFDPSTGQYVPDTRPLALDDVWVLAPTDTILKAFDEAGEETELRAIARLPTPTGSWSGFTAQHISLFGITSIHASVQAPGAERANEAWIRAMRPAHRVRSEGPLVPAVTGELGEPVFREFPRLVAPVVQGYGDDRLQVAITGPEVHFEGTAADWGRDGSAINLPPLPSVLVGAFDVRIRGPLGADLRERFIVVSGLDVVPPSELLLPGDRTKRNVGVRADPGVEFVDLGPEVADGIPVPTHGTMLSVTAAASGGSVSLQIALPRLQWGVKTMESTAVLAEDVVRIDRDDISEGVAEALVVATHRPGTAMVLELWSSAGVKQESPQAEASPRDGRWAFDLSRFKETIRLTDDPRLRLRLRVEGHSVPLADLTASVDASGFVVNTESAEDQSWSTTVVFTQGRPLRDRVARLWSLDRPWAASIDIPIADDAAPCFVVTEAVAVPGRYRVQIAVDDGWTSPRRPSGGTDSTAEADIGPSDKVVERQSSLAGPRPSDVLEVIALSGDVGFAKEASSRGELANLAFHGVLANLEDEPVDALSRATMAMLRVAATDVDALIECVGRAYESERADREFLLRVFLLVQTTRPDWTATTATDRAMRTVWQACPPMAAMVDVPAARHGSGDAIERAEQYLGWHAGDVIESRPGLKLHEIELPAPQLRAIRIGLGLLPSEVLSGDTWVLATIEWLSLQDEDGRFAEWWRRFGWLAESRLDHLADIGERIRGRAPQPHPEKWPRLPQATLSAAAHLVRGDADRDSAAIALTAVADLGAYRLVVHDLCLARAMVSDVTTAAKVPGSDGLTEGARVRGSVVQWTQEGAFVDVGADRDAFLPNGELGSRLAELGHPEVGTAVDAIIISVDEDAGRCRLSVRTLESYDQLVELRAGDPVVGPVVAVSNASLVVDIGFICGFLPLSEYDELQEARPEVGARVAATVRSANAERASVQLTRSDITPLLDELSSMREGDVLTATIVAITQHGLVVERGLVRGYVPGKHLPQWPTAAALQDYVIGEGVSVEVVAVHHDRGQVDFSMRHLGRGAFESVTSDIAVGDVMDISVELVLAHGLIVRAGDVTGFVHRTELAWEVDTDPEDYTAGSVHRAVVVSVDTERMRVNYSIKQAADDPFPSEVEDLVIGSEHTARATAFVKFGAFMRLSDTLEALLHISEFPDPYPDGDDPEKFMDDWLAIGETARVRILSIDPDKRRVSLTMRDVHPWLDEVGLPALGEAVAGRVSATSRHGVHVDLGNRLEGLVPIDQHEIDSNAEGAESAAANPWPAGTMIEGRVASLDRGERRIVLTEVRTHPVT